MIYEHAARMTQDQGTIDIAHIDWGSDGRQYARRPHWLFLGLTQTCQLIRKEFRPWFMQHLSVATRFPRAVEFFDTFAKTALADARSAPKAIDILVDYLDDEMFVEEMWDITLIWRLMASDAGPRVDFKCRDDDFHNIVPILNRPLESLEWKSAWAKALETHIIKADWFTLPDSAMVEFTLRNPCGLDWVDKWGGEGITLEEVNKGADEFLSALGFNEEPRIGCVIWRGECDKEGENRPRVEVWPSGMIR